MNSLMVRRCREHHADVDEFGGGSPMMLSREFFVGRRKNELQQAGGVAGDMTASVV